MESIFVNREFKNGENASETNMLIRKVFSELFYGIEYLRDVPQDKNGFDGNMFDKYNKYIVLSDKMDENSIYLWDIKVNSDIYLSIKVTEETKECNKMIFSVLFELWNSIGEVLPNDDRYCDDYKILFKNIDNICCDFCVKLHRI
jgi:hypothetical protein